ncbi:MAG: EAL domain-containing protein, partial [Azovibrio sp.]
LSSQLENYPRLPSGTLEIELLESAALADLEEVGKVLTNCRKLGIGIALDDFGTGYSSLAHLRSLPADMLKVDQSFVRNMLNNTEDMAIVEGIVGLAQVFHRRIIAEGVETTAHGLMLISMGCKLAQGYIIARPMPAADIAWWIRDWVPEESWLSARSLEPIFPFC